MDPISSRIKKITNELKEYLEARIDLLVLNVGEQVTKVLGESLQKLVGFTIFGVGIFFVMIALAIYLGDVLDNEALGYLIVSLPLIVLGALFAKARPRGVAKSIQNQFMEGVLASLEDDKTEEEDKPQVLIQNSPKQLAKGDE